MTVKLSINGIAELDFPTGVSSVSVSQEVATVNLTGGSTSFNGVNAQTGVSYTFVNGDNLKLVTLNNAGAVAVTLPQAGSGGNFNSTWAVFVENLGVGVVTITPTTSTIDGATSILLNRNQGVSIFSDGTNYSTERGMGNAGTVTSVALTMPAEFSVSGSPVTGSGTFTVTKANETANTVFVGPSSGGAAAPTFRALVPADCPAMVASGVSHKAGIVPDPGAVAGTTKFLREDASFQTIAEASISLSDVTTDNVTSTAHGFAPKSPADATKFLNGAATPDYAQVKDSDLSTSDVTTNNVSITKHGFAPKAPNDVTKFLDGTGAYSVPSSGGSGTGFAYGGDGSDGAVTFDGSSTVLGFVPASSAYLLTRDIYCTTLVVNSGVVVKTGNCVISASTSVTVNGTIRSNGTTGANGGIGSPTGTGGSAGIAGAHADTAGTVPVSATLPFPFSSGSAIGGTLGGAGNTGAGSAAGAAGAGTGVSDAIARSATTFASWSSGAGGAGSGGAGGGATNSGTNGVLNVDAAQPRVVPTALTFRNRAGTALTYSNGAPAAAGGGGGGGDATNKGGGGGGGGSVGGSGGYIVITSPTITVAASGVIAADGAVGSNGGNGGTPTTGNCGGGGGGAGGAGGNGGVIALIYHSYTNSGSVHANGGSGGNGGTHGNGVGTGVNGNDGAGGPTGTAGLVIQIAV